LLKMERGIVKHSEKRYQLRILGLDYGEKRMGVAVCDELGLTAQGLPTLIRKTKKQDLETLQKLIDTYNIEKIVIGYPVRLDGTEGIQCDKVNRFCEILAENFSLPIVKWSEELSTKEAEEILINSGVRWRKRKDKIDKLAACLILQGYLDSIGGKE